MMLAWTSLSVMMMSSLSMMAGIVPRLTWKPVLKTRAASMPMYLASRSSSSMWRSSVPLRKREPVQLVPYFLMASMAASLTLGWLVSPT